MQVVASDSKPQAVPPPANYVPSLTSQHNTDANALGVVHVGPSPAALQLPNQRPPPGAPLTAEYVAQKVTSGAGAVGQAAPQTAPTCEL